MLVTGRSALPFASKITLRCRPITYGPETNWFGSFTSRWDSSRRVQVIRLPAPSQTWVKPRQTDLSFRCFASDAGPLETKDKLETKEKLTPSQASRLNALIHPSEWTLMTDPSVTDTDGKHVAAIDTWHKRAQQAEEQGDAAKALDAYRQMYQLAYGVDDHKANIAWDKLADLTIPS